MIFRPWHAFGANGKTRKKPRPAGCGRFPQHLILARACSRNHAHLLHEAGVQYFVEQLGSSLDCAIASLDAIGHDIDHAKDAARRFKEMEFAAIASMATHRDDEKNHISAAQQNLSDLESLMENAPIRKAKQSMD